MYKIITRLVVYMFLLSSAMIIAQEIRSHDNEWYKKQLSDGVYDNDQPKDFPSFKYQRPKNSDLSNLKNKYKLDSIAGNSTDINQILNLLSWMHHTVPHEDEENLSILTAQNIIDTYKNKGFSQGCYPLAIAMNEIFLSMGFKSRIVICFPADSAMPNGGHVINTVFVPSLRKWIWADPQYNAYLKDENGTYLSIAEVREYVVSGRPVYLNQDADYHGEKVNLTYYLDGFMLEFLYRFISPVYSRYNSETRNTGKTLRYTELVPCNGILPDGGTFESHKARGVRVITYHTCNASAFWEL